MSPNVRDPDDLLEFFRGRTISPRLVVVLVIVIALGF